jgi:DNA-binding CsgD family transcriptional regulator
MRAGSNMIDMEHWTFLFYNLSFCAGIGAVAIALVLYKIYRKKSLLYFTYFMVSMAFIMGELTAMVYGRINFSQSYPAFYVALDLLDKAGVLLFIFTFPLFIHTLFGIKRSSLRNRIFRGIQGISTILIFISLIPGIREIVRIPMVIIYYGLMIYALVLGIFTFRSIGSRLLRRLVIIFLIISMIFIPLIILEQVRDRLPQFQSFRIFELFSLPLYFLILSVLSILMAVWYLGKPPFIEGGHLSAHFQKYFEITDREKEIVQRLISGHSYNDIADNLCIAYKTVDTHVQNIYRKTSVKNRIQLINLIQSSL